MVRGALLWRRAGVPHARLTPVRSVCRADTVLADTTASQYVDGVAVHWYEDDIASASRLNETHARHPDTFILGTEACEGSFPWARGPSLGDWHRADAYAHDIILQLSNWVVGWTDWNLALDMQGGPNWVDNFGDAPVIVDAANGVR